MADNTQTNPHDYSTGVPRKHHSLYLDDGTFVMQVENAIFKIHRSLLARYSTVIKDMLDAPNGNGSSDGTDENPLVMVGDSAVGWELLFELQYTPPSLRRDDFSTNGEKMLLILPVAHKYCMESIEVEIINGLDRSSMLKEHIPSDAKVHVDLMVASRIIGSEARYQQALQRLISSKAELGLDQAKRIGTEATHTILMAALSTTKTELTSVNTTLRATVNALESSNRTLTNSNSTLTSSNMTLTSSNSTLTSSNTTLTNSNATLTRNNATLTNTNTTLTTTNMTLANSDNRKCRHCTYITNWNCTSCRRNQV